MSDTPDPLSLVEEMESLIAEREEASRQTLGEYEDANGALADFCTNANLRSLCEAVRAARKDTELLDRLDKTLDPVTEGTDSNGGVEHVGNAWGVFGQYDTVREAIDAECPASPIGPETP